MKRTFTFTVAAALVGMLAFSGSGFAAKGGIPGPPRVIAASPRIWGTSSSSIATRPVSPTSPLTVVSSHSGDPLPTPAQSELLLERCTAEACR